MVMATSGSTFFRQIGGLLGTAVLLSLLLAAMPTKIQVGLTAASDAATKAAAVYRVAMWVVLLAFVLSLFFRTPPLRARSALQDDAKRAADETGALVEPAYVPMKSGD